jgi:hypothetical protein
MIRPHAGTLSVPRRMLQPFLTGKRRTLLTGGLLTLGYAALMVATLSLAGPKALYMMLAFSAAPLVAYRYLKSISSLVLAYVALLPFIQHLSFSYVQVGEFLMTPHMVVQGIIMAGILISFLGSYDPSRRGPLNGLDRTFLLFALLSVFSLMFAATLPVDHTKRWLLFYTGVVEPVGFYFAILFLLARDDKFPDKFLQALVLTSFSAAIVALIEFSRIGFDPIRIFLARMTIGFGYHNTNLFGIHSVIMFPVIVYAVAHSGSTWKKFMAWSSLFLLTVLSVLCFNRGTVIVLLLQVAFLYAIRENRRPLRVLLAGLGLVVIFYSRLILLYLFRFLAGAEGAGAGSPLLDASALYRLQAWKVGLRILVEYPFGVGGGGFQYIWRLSGPDPTFFRGTPHHLFLSIGVDYGVLALAAFVGILGLSYKYASALQGSVEGNPYRDLFRYIRISLIGFVAYGMITDGELSHLTGFIAPNNGYTLLLFSVLAFVSFSYSCHLSSLQGKNGHGSEPGFRGSHDIA